MAQSVLKHSLILDTVWPLCLPVTHCTQTEISQLSQRKIKSSLCSSHLNFTSGTIFSPLWNSWFRDTFCLLCSNFIKTLTEEGSKLKAMVDRHIKKMIATLNEKARQEKEPLAKTLSDYKQLLEKVTFRSKVVRPSSICFSLRWNSFNFEFISFLTAFLRVEINSLILDTVWPLCLPVTHCTQTEIAQLSQRKIKSSLCSSQKWNEVEIGCVPNKWKADRGRSYYLWPECNLCYKGINKLVIFCSFHPVM
jgi:hypothetical protein